VGTGRSALQAGRNGSRLRAIYVDFSGQYRGVMCGKRGEFVVSCVGRFALRKMRHVFQLFFLGRRQLYYPVECGLDLG